MTRAAPNVTPDRMVEGTWYSITYTGGDTTHTKRLKFRGLKDPGDRYELALFRDRRGRNSMIPSKMIDRATRRDDRESLDKGEEE